MVSLYIVSTTSFSGKTALAISLGKRFIDEGFSVGYMKPVRVEVQPVGERFSDEDTAFIKEAFGLIEPPELLAPVSLNPATVEAILAGRQADTLLEQIKSAYAEVSAGKDVVILEGSGRLCEGALAGLSPSKLVELLQAHTLVVAKYSNDLVVDEILMAKQLLGQSLTMAVINAVPKIKLPFVHEMIEPFLRERGIKSLAILPEEKVLLSVSVKELAECLGGQIICCPEHTDELVENLLVGAMSSDSALIHFRRKPNKAVITGGDRPDIQLAALQTPTKCLILTGNLHPSPSVLGHAEEAGVPIILASQDTLTTVEIVQQFFGKTRFHQPEKIEHFQRILNEHFDFEALYEELGLAKAG